MTTDIQGSQNLPHLDPGMGLKLGVLGFFPIIKIIVVRQMRSLTCMYCNHECEDKHVYTAWRTKIVNTLILHLLLRVWPANPEDPQIEPRARQRRGGVGGPGSLLYICGYNTEYSFNLFLNYVHKCK